MAVFVFSLNLPKNKNLMKNLLFALSLLCITGCGSTEDVASIGLRNFSNSGCKLVTEMRASNNLFGEEKIVYEASTNGRLVVKHVNALFGCDAKVSAEAHLDKDNKTIVINETVTNESANCVCPYDLTMEVGELQETTYTLKVIHKGSTVLTENINYSKDLKGERKIGD